MSVDIVLQVGALVVGSVGVGVALLNQRQQRDAQMFIEFSGRFQDLLRLFPTEAWLANLNPSLPLPPSTQEITDCTLYCMQLVADVFQLHESGFISSGLWKLWQRRAKRALTGRVFQREWEKVAVEFTQDAEFLDYIGAMMRPRQSPNAVVLSADAY